MTRLIGDSPPCAAADPQPDRDWADPDRPILSLLLAHQRRSWRRGGRAPVEAYLAQQPGLGDDGGALLDLIYGEIVLREELGESPGLEEYLVRFPRLAPQLKIQFDVEGALRA